MDSLALKLTEPQVSTDDPWADDVLGRKQIAARLTNLIRHQSLPFTISIHGQWGTGKTFMLKRWQRDLENQEFKAIYFNAWEDDFCDDPLLAILAQLARHFKERGLKKLARRAAKIAIPLFRENALGVVKATTGITPKANHQVKDKTPFLEAYLEQKATRDNLKNHLAKLSCKVAETNGHPVVFIIDELDRCRPTFAIELLERVKHIFDVPNMVFVLGINREELCKAIQSIYGEIEADVYLRRFFDMEFVLPEVGAEQFGKHLIREFKLAEFFTSLSKSANRKIHTEDFNMLDQYFPILWSRLSLSLRDIDYCVRLIALAGRSLTPGYTMYPWLLGLLVTLQLKNPTLYRRYIQGDCMGSEIMDYIGTLLPPRDQDYELEQTVSLIEAFLYLADEGSPTSISSKSGPFGQLELLQHDLKLTHAEYLSERTKKSGSERASSLLDKLKLDRMRPSGDIRSYLGRLINLHQGLTRR